MAIAGLRGTGDWTTDERPKNFREMILWRNPNGQAPLTALMARMQSESIDDPEFAWYEEELNALRLTIAGTAPGGAGNTFYVTSNVTNALDCVPGDVFKTDSILTNTYANEILVVSSVTDAGTVVFKRGQAGSAAETLSTIGLTLTKIGSMFAEGVGAPPASMRNPTKLYNLAQIFRTTYQITETAKRTRTRTGDPVKNDKKRKMFDHSTAMEFAFLFGKRFEQVGANGKPMRLTGGLLWFLSQYAPSMITAFTTTPTESTFTDAIYKVFDYNSGAGAERIVFAGNGALNSLNRLAATQSRTRVNFDGIIDVYGMKLQRWVLPQGTLYVKSHPLFNTHPVHTYDMAVLDPTALKYRHLRDTTFKDNIQAPDEDSTKGQWLTEAGIEVQHAKTMTWLSNFRV